MEHTTEKNHSTAGASFRDPSGFIFAHHGVLYRQVNDAYARSYDMLMSSGLYRELTEKKLLVPHEEVQDPRGHSSAWKVIRPDHISFISYPYEWCFSELKDAALLTLKVQRIALRHGMSLKDASAYNVQFVNGKPVFIDTLSFEPYREGAPWAAYRQFCRHFFAPLALMSFAEVRLGQLLRIYIDGVPLDLASALLPMRSWFRASVFFHIHMHAKSERRYAGKKLNLASGGGMSRGSLDGLMDSLKAGISSLRFTPAGTEWDEYYENTNYSDAATKHKFDAVAKFIAAVAPKNVWDLGANEGMFSRAASERGIPTTAFDIDPASVEKNYLRVKKENEERILPLLLDLTNPSPALGWNNTERASLAARGPADAVLALALIHHLAISNNVPFALAAEFFAGVSKTLIIEFVPKEDSQVQRLLMNRGDIFDWYTEKNFTAEFAKRFTVAESYRIPGSERTLYLMRNKRA